MRRTILRFAAAAALALPGAGALADERSDFETLRAATIKLIELLVTEGVLTQEKANALLRQAESAAPPPGAKPPAPVSVPYVPQAERDKIKEELREEVMSQARAERWAEPGRLPLWADRLVLTGDVRLRLQHDMLDENNAPAAFFQALGQNIANSTEDRTRLRLRARLGVHANVTEGVRAGIGLATGTVGSTGTPNSTNNTLGDYENRQPVGFDFAYLSWQPSKADWLTVIGGRFANPFLASDMIWAPDLRLDGLAFNLRFVPREDLQPFFVLGAFPLRDFEPAPDNPTRQNKWFYGTQVGVDYGYPQGTLLRLGLAYYDYRDIEGIPNTDPLLPNQYDWTAPQFRQKGNTMFPINLAGNPALYGLASQFRVLNFTGELGLRYDEFRRVTLLGDWARNTGFDSEEIFRRTGGLALDKRADAWHLQLAFGHTLLERWGDWYAFGGYKSIQRDALLDAFNDGDFHLGGTDAKGWYLGGGYAVGRNTWFSVKYMSANEIDGPPLAIDVLQLDFNARF
jgi:hypothetical protein